MAAAPCPLWVRNGPSAIPPERPLAHAHEITDSSKTDQKLCVWITRCCWHGDNIVPHHQVRDKKEEGPIRFGRHTAALMGYPWPQKMTPAEARASRMGTKLYPTSTPVFAQAQAGLNSGNPLPGRERNALYCSGSVVNMSGYPALRPASVPSLALLSATSRANTATTQAPRECAVNMTR